MAPIPEIYIILFLLIFISTNGKKIKNDIITLSKERLQGSIIGDK